MSLLGVRRGYRESGVECVGEIPPAPTLSSCDQDMVYVGIQAGMTLAYQ